MKYLLHNQATVDKDEVYERYLVKTEIDIQILLKKGIITPLHIDGMRKYIVQGEQVIVNESGGYCNAKGTWEIIK